MEGRKLLTGATEPRIFPKTDILPSGL